MRPKHSEHYVWDRMGWKHSRSVFGTGLAMGLLALRGLRSGPQVVIQHTRWLASNAKGGHVAVLSKPSLLLYRMSDGT